MFSAIFSSPRCRDRKSTRLNSSHLVISYAVFCLKKKDTNILLYMYGGRDPANQAKAAELFNAQTRTARAVLSTQVVHFFFFNDTATTEIYTLSLHDALPI